MRNFGVKHVTLFTEAEVKAASGIGFTVGVVCGILVSVIGVSLFLYSKGLIW